jgi:hypothetical protein
MTEWSNFVVHNGISLVQCSLSVVTVQMSQNETYLLQAYTYFTAKIHSDKGNYYKMRNEHRPQQHNYYTNVKILWYRPIEKLFQPKAKWS